MYGHLRAAVIVCGKLRLTTCPSPPSSHHCARARRHAHPRARRYARKAGAASPLRILRPHQSRVLLRGGMNEEKAGVQTG